MTGFHNSVLAALRGEGAHVHVVGGAVRDALLGRRSSDLDLSVDMSAIPLAEQLAKNLGAHAVVLDRERDQVRLVTPTDGEVHWVDIASNRGDLAADLARRDFTIDAMAVPLDRWPQGIEESVVDLYGGRVDLEQRVLRTVGPTSLADDPVRLLRAVRMASQLGFQIEHATASGIRRLAGKLSNVAPERVRAELFEVFASPVAQRGVELMDEYGLLEAVLPEIGEGRGVTQPPNHHYWDVFDHCVHAVGKVDLALEAARSNREIAGAVIPWEPELIQYFDEIVGDGHTRLTLLRLTALLHDVAKPRCKTMDASGRMRFLGHHELGARMAEEMLTRLRCSRRTVLHVSKMVRYHLRPGQMRNDDALPTDRAVFRYFRDVSPVAVDTAYLNIADYLAARGSHLDARKWREYVEMIGDILARGFDSPRQSRPFLLLDGNEVMSEFGLRPGPEIGRLLSALRDAEAAGTVQTRVEALEYLRRFV